MTFIQGIKTDSEDITLTKLNSPMPEILLTDQESMSIAFLDTETTGIDRRNDKIIELAIKVVQFEQSTGKIININQIYESFNDPGEDIGQDISMLTGIDNVMVEGNFIKWVLVDELLENTNLIVSHNAGFDRAFIDRYSSVSQNKIWSCSINDINWLERGFSSSKQELLCYWHGFYFDAHRAMNDVDALINLLTHKSYKKNKPIIELIQNSNKPDYLIFAENFNYNPQKKDILKANKYKWNPEQKLWYKKINIDNLETEKNWLTSIIYNGNFEGRIKKINLADKYKL